MNRARKLFQKRVTIQQEADFTNVPTATICKSIQLLVDELNRRGEPIHDFDNKGKLLQQIRILDKVYFLAAEDKDET